MDISFLLPTVRNWPKYGQRVVDSIQRMDSPKNFRYEILVSSFIPVEGPDIVWVEDKVKLGALHAFNELACYAKGDYLVCLVDDHTIEGKMDAITQSGLDIASIPSGGRCPIPNHPPFFTGHIAADLLYQWTTVRFPVVKRQTWRERLGSHIFHPGFLNSHADIYLGVWMGINGEPCQELDGIRLREFEHIHNASRESDLHDEAVCVRLMNTIVKGHSYV